jgi:hypothetical protein
VKQVVQYEPPTAPRDRAERVFSHLVVMRGKEREHRDSAYALRTYSARQWRAVVRAAGFRVAGVVDEEGEAMAAPEIGYAVYVLAPTGSRSSG